MPSLLCCTKMTPLEGRALLRRAQKMRRWMRTRKQSSAQSSMSARRWSVSMWAALVRRLELEVVLGLGWL